jgi:predicted small integral membrane protein
MNLTWMGWTWQTGLFFAGIAVCLATLTALALLRPELPRAGVLGLTTTRGDRLFLSLLGAAFIHLAWLGLAGDVLWPASLIALCYAAFVFRFV